MTIGIIQITVQNSPKKVQNLELQKEIEKEESFKVRDSFCLCMYVLSVYSVWFAGLMFLCLFQQQCCFKFILKNMRTVVNLSRNIPMPNFAFTLIVSKALASQHSHPFTVGLLQYSRLHTSNPPSSTQCHSTTLINISVRCNLPHLTLLSSPHRAVTSFST